MRRVCLVLGVCCLLPLLCWMTSLPQRSIVRPHPRASFSTSEGLSIKAFAFAPDGTRLAASYFPRVSKHARVSGRVELEFGMVQVFDLGTFSPRVQFPTQGRRDGPMQFSADSQTLIALSQDSVIVWDGKSGGLTTHPQMLPILISSNGNLIVSNAGENWNGVELKNWRTGAISSLIELSDYRLFPVALSSDATLLATAGHDTKKSELLVWKLPAGEIVCRIPIASENMFRSVMTPDGQRLATVNDTTAMIKIWDGQSGSLLNTLQFHAITLWDGTCSPDGRYFAVCGEVGRDGQSGGIVWVKDIETGEDIFRHLDPRTWGITAVAFSPDGKTLATGTGQGQICLWDFPPQKSVSK